MEKNFSFSKWVRFDERKKLEQLKYPGIYAIAYSNEDISGKDFDWIKEIVYIGMSFKRNLRIRLEEFYKTINLKSGQHDPAKRFCFNLDNEDENWREKLCVSVMPIPCDVRSNSPKDLICMGEIEKQEYVCFAKYVRKHKEMPRFNDEKRSPKK
jgi:hypothetical protein